MGFRELWEATDSGSRVSRGFGKGFGRDLERSGCGLSIGFWKGGGWFGGVGFLSVVGFWKGVRGDVSQYAPLRA